MTPKSIPVYSWHTFTFAVGAVNSVHLAHLAHVTKVIAAVAVRPMNVQIAAVRVPDHVLWMVEGRLVVQFAFPLLLVVVHAVAWRILVTQISTLFYTVRSLGRDHVAGEDLHAQLSLVDSSAHVGGLQLLGTRQQQQQRNETTIGTEHLAAELSRERS